MDCMTGAAWMQFDRTAPDWLGTSGARLIDVENESHESGSQVIFCTKQYRPFSIEFWSILTTFKRGLHLMQPERYWRALPKAAQPEDRFLITDDRRPYQLRSGDLLAQHSLLVSLPVLLLPGPSSRRSA